jgi:hypothetical protein
MESVTVEQECWRTHQGEMWQLLTLRELIAVYQEWQEVELRPVLPNVPSREVLYARILHKGAFLALLLIQPFLQFLLGKFGTTLEEFIVICGLFSHSQGVFTIMQKSRISK